MGAVQIQSRANPSSFFLSFIFTPCLLLFLISHTLSTLPVYLCPSRWRCEIFKCTLLFGDNADGPSPPRPRCMQISIQSSPGCFQYNTSASGPVLIPLYPQPMHCFIQSNALSAMSTWTSGHITEPKIKKCGWILGSRDIQSEAEQAREERRGKVIVMWSKICTSAFIGGTEGPGAELVRWRRRSAYWGETGATVAFFIVS